MTITLNSLFNRQLTFVSLSSFSGVLSCVFVWNVFFYLLLLPVCFSVLGRSAMSPGL